MACVLFVRSVMVHNVLIYIFSCNFCFIQKNAESIGSSSGLEGKVYMHL